MRELDQIIRTSGLSAAQTERIQPQARAFGELVHAGFSPSDEEAILHTLKLMLTVHADQPPRPDGAPYIEHPLAVASGVVDAMAQKDPDLVMAALLHDTVEDQATKLVQMAGAPEGDNSRTIALNFIEQFTGKRRIRAIVDALSNPDFDALLQQQGIQRGSDQASQQAYTRARNALYAEHTRTIMHNPDAALVKLFDFSTNALSLAGVPNEATRQRFARKYGAAINIIIDRLQDDQQPLNLLPEKRNDLLARLILAREYLTSA